VRVASSLAICLLVAFSALADDPADSINLAPPQYRQQLGKQLTLAGKNQPELLASLRAAKPEYRESLTVLLANMPEQDLASLSKDFLLANVEYACKARSEMPWGKAVSDEMFFNYVLPYANVNERRDDWRKDFYQRFAGNARQCHTTGEAANMLNKEVFSQLKVKYHPTKRPKPDQSPYESTKAGYASCTGLSILLVDACRAVCIPARIVGIAEWTNKSGNHTWVEIWDRQWCPLGAAEPGVLNDAWLSRMATSVNPEHRANSIFAVSFLPAETWFPMAWAPENRTVPADDVTRFYTDRRHVTFHVVDYPRGRSVPSRLIVRWGGRLVAEDVVTGPTRFVLAAGQTYEVQMQRSESSKIFKQQVCPTTDDSQVIELPIGRL
jgi:hypothetical protein